MLGSTVLRENRDQVSKQLMTISGVGITLLYGISLVLWWQGYVSISAGQLLLAALLSYVLYGVVCLCYLVQALRAWFHYLFPLEMYVTVAIGFAAFEAPVAAFGVWILPVIYAGMYAKRAALLLISLLVLVTAPLVSYLIHKEQWQGMLPEVLIALVVMLVVVLRMLSLINRSRAVLLKTVQEVAKNQELEQANRMLIQEVAATAEEIGRVVQTVVEMTGDTREALAHIAKGADEMTAASKDSLQLLIRNQQGVEQQADRSVQIGQAILQAVHLSEETREQAMAGERTVMRMGDVMQTIEGNARDSTRLVSMLAERTQEIEGLNNTVADIAKHINVVAINASIEAARAGAGGKTFAVVAEQIQGLARETTEAVKAIGDLAVNIRSDLELVTAKMEESGRIVESGVAVAGEARGRLLDISQAAVQIHSLMDQIAWHAREQQQEAKEIVQGIAVLRRQTDGNVAHIEGTAAAAEETSAIMEEYIRYVEKLRERAELLQHMLGKLKLQEKSP